MHGWIYQEMFMNVLIVVITDGGRSLACETIHKMNQHLDQKLDASRCILSNILSFSLLNP